MEDSVLKAHVLTSRYRGSEGETEILRIYLEKDLPQALKDLKLLESVSDKQIMLRSIEVYNPNSSISNCVGS